MHAEDIREFALSLADVEEGSPFGPNTLVFKTKGKMFLLLSLDEIPLRCNVKCEPEKALALREEFPDAVAPGYHMNKKHWNTITPNLLKGAQVKEFIQDSYRLVRGKEK